MTAKPTQLINLNHFYTSLSAQEAIQIQRNNKTMFPFILIGLPCRFDTKYLFLSILQFTSYLLLLLHISTCWILISIESGVIKSVTNIVGLGSLFLSISSILKMLNSLLLL